MTSHTISSWLSRIGQSESFLTPRLSQLTDPAGMLDRSIVVGRIAEAIKLRQVIGIAADYDVDGIGAGTIITHAIRTMGGTAHLVLASRFDGGYGFSDAVADRVLATGARLLVTCDCGSSDHPRIERMNAAGVDVLVIDHHLVPDKPLPAMGFINPHRPECPFPYKDMSSVGLAFSVVAGVRHSLGIDFDPRQYLDLVAVGTIADVMPLTGDNRCLVRAGLAALSRAERPGMRALLGAAKIEPGFEFTGRDIGFRIAPLINAPGRLGSPDIIAQLLLAETQEEADALAMQVKDISDRRRLITEAITEEAVKEIADHSYGGDPAIVIGREAWNHGIVGIVAGRLTDRFKVPVIVCGSEGRGSVRGPQGSRLYDALAASSETMVKFGGHQAAAGCQVEWSRLGDLRAAFCRAVESQPAPPPVDESALILPLDLQDSQLIEVANDLMALEPCGQGNPRPVLEFLGEIRSAKEVKGGHLKFEMALDNERVVGGFCIGLGSQAESLVSQRVRVLGDLRKNTWRGRTKAEIFVKSLDVLT